MGAGALALGSKAALMIKSGSGIGGLAKGVGLLAVGGAPADQTVGRSALKRIASPT